MMKVFFLILNYNDLFLVFILKRKVMFLEYFINFYKIEFYIILYSKKLMKCLIFLEVE